MNLIRRRDNFDLHFKKRFPAGEGYLFAFAVLFALLIIIYSNSFQGSWHLDDYANIVDNTNVHLHTLSWPAIVKTFQGMEPDQGALRRPLAYLSFALNYFWNGTDVFGYHLVNFIVHYLTAVLLYLLIRNTLELPRLQSGYAQAQGAIALLAAVLWATHPLQVTAVTYIVQRMTSLATLFYVMGMYFYVKARTASSKRSVFGLLVLTFLAFCGACACKENAVMLPASLFLYDVVLIQPRRPAHWSKVIILGLAAFGLILLVAWPQIDLEGLLAGYKARPFSWQQRLMTEPRVIWYYVSLILYPASFRLTLLHDFDVSTTLFTPWTTLPAIVALFGVVIAAVAGTRRKPLMAYAVYFFLLNHVIEGSFIPLELVFEHRNYLPSTFLFVPLAVGIVYVLDYFSYHKGLQTLVAASVAFAIAAQGHTVYFRNGLWSDEVSLWRDNAAKAPALHRPHHNLGKALLVQGRLEEALAEMQAALKAKCGARTGQKYTTHHNLGVYYLYLGHYAQALYHFAKTLEYIPDHAPTLHLIAKIMLYQDRLSAARRYVDRAIRLCPECAEFRLTSSFILLKTGDADGALRALAQASRLDPDDKRIAYFKGEALRYRNDWEGALASFERYRADYPGQVPVVIALIELYYVLDRRDALDRSVAQLMGMIGDERLDDVLLKFNRETNALGYERIETVVQAIKLALGRQIEALDQLLQK